MAIQNTTYFYPDMTVEMRCIWPKYDTLRKMGLEETADILYYLKMEQQADGVYQISYERR